MVPAGHGQINQFGSSDRHRQAPVGYCVVLYAVPEDSSRSMAFLDRPSRRAHTCANQYGPVNAFHSVDHNTPTTWSHAMRRLPICLLGAFLLNLLVAYQLNAQEKSDGSTTSSRTFRPVVRGTQCRFVDETGGNSSRRANSGIGWQRVRRHCGRAGRAGAGQSRVQWSGRRRGHPGLPRGQETGVLDQCRVGNPAPKLATIDWYNKHNGGKIPNSDGLLSASLPGVIDAWYVLLDRWGTMTFAQVLEQAIDVAENGFPNWRWFGACDRRHEKDPEISNLQEGVFSTWQGPAPNAVKHFTLLVDQPRPCAPSPSARLWP